MFYCDILSRVRRLERPTTPLTHIHEKDANFYNHPYQRLSPHQISYGNILPNSTTTHSVTLAEKIKPQGKCNSTTYSIWNLHERDRTGICKNNAQITHGLSETFREQDRSPIWPTVSMASLDNEDGYTYWNPTPADFCKFQNYDVLYDS
ncbi:hypothetical protein K0M31_001262 [Melipona bicolor]|uniref:Uncharacterized protein n=1 Tax=Melipona bicolor TaxID=60889 RepID=A0AA40GF50_9HYME|nr:hypothetical protein K0M31_001262 [Melipona bicolor]